MREAINVGLTKLGFKEIRENQRKVVEAYVGTDRLREKSDVSHRSICIGFFQTWRTRSCRHSLPRYFPFGLTNERSSVDPSRERGQSRCLGPRNFRDRKQRSFRGKIQPRVHESRSAIWQSSFQYIGTEEQNSGCIHR